MKNFQKNIRERTKSFIENIKDSYYIKIGDLNITAFLSEEPLSYADRQKGTKVFLSPGDKWGNLFDCAWFCFTGEIPDGYENRKLVLVIDVNGEGCIYNRSGEPMQGITTGTSVYEYESSRKRVYHLDSSIKSKDETEIWMDAGNNDLFGRYVGNGTVKEVYIAYLNEELRDIYYDFALLDNVLDHIDNDSPRFYSILYCLEEAINICKSDWSNIDLIKSILKKEYDKKCGDSSLKITAIGHAHIDLAWLWPLRETVRKGTRTFSTALALMDKYQDYLFGASQPQLYEWIKCKHPALYDRIKNKIKEGRWEAQGAMWVEADTNLTGGESLIRQILYGTRFYKKEFGIDVNNLWLPDVFGYSGSLPQILAKSQIPYFLTIKLSWNRINKFPYSTFIWKGIDGSKVLCHMPPEGNYNSAANAESLKLTEKNFNEKGLSDEVLLLYGVGNGGGGPAAHHQERLRRLKNFVGLPPVKQDFAANFFNRINKYIDSYPVWEGELYLECHQGTYTTQARNKKYNRKLEFLLREVEYACVLAMKYTKMSYPQDEIEKIWKEVLLYQFHDILPGSSIKRVYDECIKRYKILERQINSIIDNAYKSMMAESDDSHTVINSLGWERKGWIRLDGKWTRYSIAPFSFLSIKPVSGENCSALLSYGGHYMENEYLKVEFDNKGPIKRIYDKQNGREVLKDESLSNVLKIYKDTENAWDMDATYFKEPNVECFDLIEQIRHINGPNVIFENIYKYNKSKLTQKVLLTTESRLITFETKVDWHETGKMLRSSFYVSPQSSEATCNIQFGSIKRPTHTNTSWDRAKYEVCAHKWIDISEEEYGVSLINDCKYGHRVEGGVLDINLLRSTSHPGKEADQGKHSFTYALYPHSGNCHSSEVERLSMELNVDITVYKNFVLQTPMNSFISSDKNNIVFDTIKKCEDSDDIAVRMFESSGKTTKACITVPELIKKALSIDLMENEIAEIQIDKGKIQLVFSPYEIITIKLM